jgi:eukaryotic-like serine/threonine-protein kinase
MTAQARLLGGRYQVGELLGYGGMAEVHRGRDLRLGRDVAIKLLRTDLARDATFQERFRREAQNAAALNHPAIVAVYDTGEETSSTGERVPFIVMEYVNGRTLKEVLATEQRLMPRRALEIIADICAALEFSHRHGIIHRDIKPGNVMMTQTGQVKVMDFGIARALASGATTMTQTSAVIGTAQYLSPEQARGEAVDARSDVYAAGCVLFELLCGHPPFVGDSPVSVAYQHVREDPRAPSDINPDVPPDVDAIVLKALAKNPLNRYQSAQEMRADALRAVSGRPVLATPVMREAETVALGSPASRQTMPTRAVPAGVGGRRDERRTSSWVMAVLAALGVLAVIALGVGLALNGTSGGEGPREVAVPSLLGLTEDEAVATLRNQGFVDARKGEAVEADNCTKGEVVEQDPAAGQQVAVNTPVTFKLCAGPEQVEIPTNLVGSTENAAVERLVGLGLVAEVKRVDNTAPKDQVVRVPQAGETVDKGSKVVVEVSRGNVRNVPSVVGKTLVEAEAILENLGFKVVRKDGNPVSPDEEPTVEAQDPTGTAKQGATITLTVTVPQDDPGSPSAPPPSEEPPPGGGGLFD